MSNEKKEKDDGAGDSNRGVDFVILWRFTDQDPEKAGTQFEKLIQSLASVGFETEVRNGENQSLLVFVKSGSDEHLAGEVYRSRIRDWLDGVRSETPDKDTKKALEDEPLQPAERLRILYQLITNPEREGGAGIKPQKGRWANVEGIFPLHDRKFNRQWIRKWSSTYLLKVEDLDEIRDQFGERVAFYFAFTQSYFVMLIAIAAFGVTAWALFEAFSPIYAIVNTALCVFFVEYWKHQQDDLAIRWRTKGVSSIEVKRHDFKPEKQITDPVTGEETQFFPASKRMRRQFLQIPFALAAAAVLGLLIATCFGIEIFVNEVYKGPGKGVLAFLPTGILTTCQPLLLGFLTNLAQQLTLFENYETDGGFDIAMTQKIFVLNFITSYLGIFLTAFVYVPFGSVIVPYLDVFNLTVKPFAENQKQMSPDTAHFHINPDRLKKQVIYFTVTAQIVNQILEVVVPYLKRRSMNKVKKMQTKRAVRKGTQSDITADDPQEERAFLERARSEAALDYYDVTTDFREMTMQYGYLSMFSVVWPPTSVSFLINNWIELRTDALKICNETRRPIPFRADGIGPWAESLAFLTWLGSITTGALVYLFRDEGLGPDGHPAGIRAWALLLTIFCCEHSYFAVRWAVQTALAKIDSPGRQKDRKERFQARKRYLDESLGAGQARSALRPRRAKGEAGKEEITREQLEEEARQDAGQDATPEGKFWKHQQGWEESVDIGKHLIEQATASEGKKQR